MIRLLAVLLTLFIIPMANGVVTTYTNKVSWESAVPSYSTIAFTELPAATWITDQYASLGVLFTDGSDQVYTTDSFITDGFGLNGAFDDSTLEFDEPITTIAMDHPGLVQIDLYYKGELFYSSPTLGIGGVGNFSGLISAQPFDKVQLHDQGLFIDNIYFGPPIPAPGALALIGLAGLMPIHGRQRRA